MISAALGVCTDRRIDRSAAAGGTVSRSALGLDVLFETVAACDFM